MNEIAAAAAASLSTSGRKRKAADSNTESGLVAATPEPLVSTAKVAASNSSTANSSASAPAATTAVTASEAFRVLQASLQLMDASQRMLLFDSVRPLLQQHDSEVFAAARAVSAATAARASASFWRLLPEGLSGPKSAEEWMSDLTSAGQTMLDAVRTLTQVELVNEHYIERGEWRMEMPAASGGGTVKVTIRLDDENEGYGRRYKVDLVLMLDVPRGEDHGCSYSYDRLDKGEWDRHVEMDSDMLVAWLRKHGLLAGDNEAQAAQLELFFEAVFHDIHTIRNQVIEELDVHAAEVLEQADAKKTTSQPQAASSASARRAGMARRRK